MPLPAAGCAADVSSDVCCDSFWLIGERLRTVACNGVCSCMDPDCAEREFRSYQTANVNIQDPLGESLIVSLQRVGLRSDSTGRNRAVNRTFVTRSEWRIQLLENGYPTAQEEYGQVIVPPDWQMVDALTKHGFGHAEKMWRALLQAATTTTLADMLFRPSSNPHIVQNRVVVGDLIPMSRPGPQLGYELSVTVDSMLS